MCPCHHLKHCCLLISIVFRESGKLSKRFIFKYFFKHGRDESSSLRHASKSCVLIARVWWCSVKVGLLYYVTITSGILRNMHIAVDFFCELFLFCNAFGGDRNAVFLWDSNSKLALWMWNSLIEFGLCKVLEGF